MSKSVEEVLTKTNEMPEIPFDGTLQFQGVEITLEVLGSIDGANIQVIEEDSQSACRDLESLPVKVEFPDPMEYTFVDPHSGIADKTVDNLREEIENLNKPLSSVTQIGSFVNSLTPPKRSSSFIVFQPNTVQYLVRPQFQLVYQFSPDGSNQKYDCVELNRYSDIPSEPAMEMSGSFTDESKDGFEFTPHLLFGFFQASSSITLRERSVAGVFDYYELTQPVANDPEPATTSVEYSACTFTLDDRKNSLTIQTENGPTFHLSLTSMGTLPDWVEERVNVGHVLTAIDTDESLIAEVDTADQQSESRWVSEDGNKVLCEIK